MLGAAWIAVTRRTCPILRPRKPRNGERRLTERRYYAVVFDLLTALLDSWTLWNAAAGSPEAGLRWRRRSLELTYGQGVYRPYEDIVRAAAEQSGVGLHCADGLRGGGTSCRRGPKMSRFSASLRGVRRWASRRTARSNWAGVRGTVRRRLRGRRHRRRAGFYKPRGALSRGARQLAPLQSVRCSWRARGRCAGRQGSRHAGLLARSMGLAPSAMRCLTTSNVR